MQNPTDQAEATVPEETVSNDSPNWNRTVAVRRKAAKRTSPFELTAEELHLVSSSSPAEDLPARKKLRLEEPLPTTTDEAAKKAASPDVAVGLPPATADNADVNADLVTDTQPTAGATQATGHWSSEEDATLTSAVVNTPMKKWGKEYKTDWDAVTALVPARTQKQCYDRWKDVLDPSINPATGCMGKWTPDEDSKLKDAVHLHGGKNWKKIAALVPGRTKNQCRSRWHNASRPSHILTTGSASKWAEHEDKKLKDAVLTHSGKNWGAIAALVPGRTKKQCGNRWHNALKPSITLTTGNAGIWAEDEDKKLKDAVLTHGGKDWAAIAALVPDRTKAQCYDRWYNAFKPSIAVDAGRTGKWIEDEVTKLKDAVLTHGDKNWKKIAALVPGRKEKQCCKKWRDVDPNRSTVRKKSAGTLKVAPALG
jgi:hypothetical protein